MAETLLSPSNVLLYGRILLDLEIKKLASVQPRKLPVSEGGTVTEKESPIPPAPPKLGQNKFLQEQFSDDAKFARIYGFSYEGSYYDVAPPAIFLVHGPGTDPEEIRPSADRISRAPADADRTGIAYTDSSFAEDIRVWSYDKGDFTVRLDPSSGTFDDVLLSYELGGDMGSFAGANARGANARGANARGANARGANARGANARGANARGANARGSSD